MANTLRVEKITAEVQRAISEILRLEVHDTRVAEHFGSITRVEVTRDLRHAKIFISVFGDEEQKQAFMKGLESAKGFIRSALGQRIRLRYIPELHFKLDMSLEKGAQVISLLEHMRAQGQL